MGGSNAETSRFIAQTPDQGFLLSGSTYSNDGDITGLHALGEAWVGKIAAAPLSVNDFDSSTIKIFPNPASETITIDGIQENVFFKVF